MLNPENLKRLFFHVAAIRMLKYNNEKEAAHVIAAAYKNKVIKRGK